MKETKKVLRRCCIKCGFLSIEEIHRMIQAALSMCLLESLMRARFLVSISKFVSNF